MENQVLATGIQGQHPPSRPEMKEINPNWFRAEEFRARCEWGRAKCNQSPHNDSAGGSIIAARERYRRVQGPIAHASSAHAVSYTLTLPKSSSFLPLFFRVDQSRCRRASPQPPTAPPALGDLLRLPQSPCLRHHSERSARALLVDSLPEVLM